MAKSSSIFVCQNCEAQFPRWQGQCSSCGEWNTLVEETRSQKEETKKSKNKKKLSDTLEKTSKLLNFSQVERTKGSKTRFSTGIGELDRVLGGGLVPGMVSLLGGEPGIGKSTLLTQVVINLLGNQKVKNQKPKSILYLAGEESPSQIALRIERILGGRVSSFAESLLFLTSTDVDELVAVIEDKKPSLIIIDSIQTLGTQDLTGASGSIGQLRESTERIIEVVKPLSIPTFLVGHVTKEGNIAGPKVLEHMVDTVLELSGERTGQLRILRAIKNRFGATDEVGVFKLADWGLEELSNPSEVFLEHSGQPVPGSAVACTLEGTRPLLIEVQALVLKSQLAMPRRVGRGIELSRIQVLAAVLQKHCKLPLGFSDIFLSAAGGFKVREPAIDLGLAAAMASSLKDKSLPKKTIFIGEIGLLGEIRSVQYLDRRIKEAKRLGFTNIISRESHKNVKAVLKELQLL